MIALIVRVNIIDRNRVFPVVPIINEVYTRSYLVRIPETGPNRHEVKPAMSNDEAVDYLLKKLKSIHGVKRVHLVKVYQTDEEKYLNAP